MALLPPLMNGEDPARHLPPVARRIYAPNYGALYTRGSPASRIADKHLVTIVNPSADGGFVRSKFVTEGVADQIFGRDLRFRGSTVALTRRTFTEGPLEERAPISSWHNTPLVGLIVDGFRHTFSFPIYHEVESQAYKETDAIRSENESTVFEIKVDPRRTNDFQVRTYSYVPEQRDPVTRRVLQREQWFPAHVFHIEDVNGTLEVTDANYSLAGGGRGILALKSTYQKLVYNLKTVKSDIVEKYQQLHDKRQELLQTRLAARRADLENEIDDILDEINVLTRQFDDHYTRIALPLFRYLKDNGRDDVRTLESMARELEDLHKRVHVDRIPRSMDLPKDPSDMTPNPVRYINEVMQKYAELVVFFNEEGRTIPEDDKNRALLPLLLRMEKGMQYQIGLGMHSALVRDNPLHWHYHEDMDFVIRHFKGPTLRDMDLERAGRRLPNLNLNALAPQLFDGSGFTYKPVIMDFLDDIIEYDARTHLPKPRFNFTELKDKFYYDEIPTELKDYMEKMYAAYKDFVAEIKQAQLEQDARDGKVGWFDKFLAFFTRSSGTGHHVSEELEMLRAMFGGANAYVRPAAGRRRGGGRGAPVPAVGAANPFAALMMAMVDSHRIARGGRVR